MADLIDRGLWLQTVPGDAISSSNDGTSTLLIRGGIFLLLMLIFIFACGYAWRKIPALRALIPEFKPGHSSLEARLQEREASQAAEPKAGNSALATAVAPPDLSKRPLTNAGLTLTPVNRPKLEARPLDNEIFSSETRLEAALADGTPGSLVSTASDLDGSIHHAPIVIVQRTDDESVS